MKIEQHGSDFIISKGEGDSKLYFAFFVDWSGVSWSKFRGWGASRYPTQRRAEETMRAIKERARRARQERDERRLK